MKPLDPLTLLAVPALTLAALLSGVFVLWIGAPPPIVVEFPPPAAPEEAYECIAPGEAALRATARHMVCTLTPEWAFIHAPGLRGLP